VDRALLLTACGGSSSSDSGSTDSGQTQDATSGASNQVGLEEFGMTDEQLVTSIDGVESAIASCMADVGFEYIPIDSVTFRDAMDSLGDAPGLSDEEFVAQYGYGLTTLPPTQDFAAARRTRASSTTFLRPIRSRTSVRYWATTSRPPLW